MLYLEREKQSGLILKKFKIILLRLGKNKLYNDGEEIYEDFIDRLTKLSDNVDKFGFSKSELKSVKPRKVSQTDKLIQRFFGIKDNSIPSKQISKAVSAAYTEPECTKSTTAEKKYLGGFDEDKTTTVEEKRDEDNSCLSDDSSVFGINVIEDMPTNKTVTLEAIAEAECLTSEKKRGLSLCRKLRGNWFRRGCK